MRSGGAYAIVCAIVLSASIASSSSPSSASSPANGAYWTYEMTTVLDVLGTIVNVSGIATYTFEGQRTLSFSGADYQADIMRVNGSLSGVAALTGQMNASSIFVVEGVQYEDSASRGIIERNITLLGSMTFTTGMTSFTNSIADTEIVLTVPPAISGFDASDVKLGAFWTKEVSETRMQTVLQDEALANYSMSWRSVVYDVEVASSAGDVETTAGSFSAVMVTATASGNETRQFWWSSAAGCFVKQLVFENGSSVPVLSLELASYDKGRTGVSLLIPAAGIAVLAIAVVVLVIELMRQRGQKAPNPPGDAQPAPSVQEPGIDQRGPIR